MCIVELSKVPMYELHYDCMRKKYGLHRLVWYSMVWYYYSQIMTDQCMKLKLKMFDFNIYSSKSKYYNDSTGILVGKMNDEMGG